MDDVAAGARWTLLAVYLASLAKTDELRTLFGSAQWTNGVELALQVLLQYIPATASSSAYLSLVNDLVRGTVERNAEDLGRIVPDEIRLLDDATAREMVESLLTADARPPTGPEADPEEAVADWIFARIYAIDSSLRILDLVDEIVSADVGFDLPDAVAQWQYGVLKPLQQFAIYYPDAVIEFSLQQIRSAEPQQVIAFLLQHASAKTIHRDVSFVVVPYVEYVETLAPDMSPWSGFFKWIVANAPAKFKMIVELVKQWGGPRADVAGYASAMIAACYQCPQTSTDYFEAMHVVQKRVSSIANSAGVLDRDDDDDTAAEMTDSDLPYPACPLYRVTRANLAVLDQLITSASMISLYVPTSVQSIAKLRYFAPQQVQLQFLIKIVRGTSKEYAYRDDSNWRSLRSAFRWLKNKSLVLSKLSDQDIENVFLSALLDFGRIGLVREIYIDPIQRPLELSEVEKHVLHAFREHYDAASNCNATRGSLKTASQLIYPSLLSTPDLQKAELLLKATHELSKYSLTLAQGVPLSPLQLRINNDPEQVISQLLQSNEKAYLQVDELVATTKNLLVGLDRHAEALQGVEYRVVRMCVYAALAADDFKTAYEYCMRRLWAHAAEIDRLDGDLLWQVFYAAGRYVSPSAPALPPSSPMHAMQALLVRNHLQVLRLQMELLARAIDICPEQNIFEILNTWQDFEVQVAQHAKA